MPISREEITIEDITDALEVLSRNFMGLTHLVQKYAEQEMRKDGMDQNNSREKKKSATSTFKIVLVGDGGVGKTTLVKRHLTGDFDPKYIPTLGVEVYPLRFNTNYGPVVFNIWDCAGQEKFRGLQTVHYVGADAAIVMYDVSNINTFKNTDKWIEGVRKMNPDLPIIVAGNKVDATKFGDLRNTVWKKEMKHYYVSAQSNYNYVRPFNELARILMKRNDLLIK